MANAIPLPASGAAWPTAAGTADATRRAVARPEPPPPSGPVLIGDLTASLGGRPLLLLLWDRDAG